MRTSTFALVASTFVGLSTQTTVSDLPFDLDISKVSVASLNSWCAGQINVCDTLCQQDTKKNSCEEGPPPVWDCSCSSNSSTPGAQYYSSSMQAQLCQQAFAQCQENNAGDSEVQKSKCEDGIRSQCGTLDIADADTGSDDSASTTTTSTKVTTTTASATDSATESGDADGLASSVPVFATSALAVLMTAFFAQLL